MKKIFNCILSISLGATALIGCNDSDVNPIDNTVESINHLEFDPSEIKTIFNEELKIYDKTGNYFVVANLGSDEEGVVEMFKNSTKLILAMTYPSDEINEGSDIEVTTDSQIKESGDVSIGFKELNLDEDANGFYIEVSHENIKSPSERILAFSYVIDYDSPDRWMYYGRVEYDHSANANPEIRVDWYYRTCTTCKMQLDWGVNLNLNRTFSEYNRYDSRRIRAKVWSNWYIYRVYFKKWGTDPWRQVPS